MLVQLDMYRSEKGWSDMLGRGIETLGTRNVEEVEVCSTMESRQPRR